MKFVTTAQGIVSLVQIFNRRALASLLSLVIAPCVIRADETEPLSAFLGELVEIKPGQGEFPKELPNRKTGASATLPPEPFRIQRYEVTQSLYEAVMGSNPSRWRGAKNAVEMVDYEDAVEFCTKLTKLLQEQMLLKSNEEVRLPRGVEWEYCCRAGSADEYCFGTDVKLLGEYGWYKENAAGNDPPVGAKKANRWGLYDMHGYVWEWCQAEKGGQAPIRGGAWTSAAIECRSGSIQNVSRASKREDVGFRCVVAGRSP